MAPLPRKIHFWWSRGPNCLETQSPCAQIVVGLGVQSFSVFLFTFSFQSLSAWFAFLFCVDFFRWGSGWTSLVLCYICHFSEVGYLRVHTGALCLLGGAVLIRQGWAWCRGMVPPPNVRKYFLPHSVGSLVSAIWILGQWISFTSSLTPNSFHLLKRPSSCFILVFRLSAHFDKSTFPLLAEKGGHVAWTVLYCACIDRDPSFQILPF